MKWQRIQVGHYVTNRPHDGLVILREGRTWSIYKHGRRVGSGYALLDIAKWRSTRK